MHLDLASAPGTPLNYKRSSLVTSSRPPSGALPGYGHLGAHSPVAGGVAAPSKKCRPAEAGCDADWQFLLSSAHHTEVGCSVSRFLVLAHPLQV